MLRFNEDVCLCMCVCVNQERKRFMPVTHVSLTPYVLFLNCRRQCKKMMRFIILPRNDQHFIACTLMPIDICHLLNSTQKNTLDNGSSRVFYLALIQLMVIVVLAWWFGFLESPDERHCYLGILGLPLRIPNHQPTPTELFGFFSRQSNLGRRFPAFFSRQVDFTGHLSPGLTLKGKVFY